MNTEKQISEMARTICQSNRDGICGYDRKPCDFNCGNYDEANKFYNAGYRKASEIFEEIEEEIELALECNYKIKRDAQDDNEGLVIYVDGKIDCLRGLTDFIAELKKKYTESEKENNGI